jgi:hypothetical protein
MLYVSQDEEMANAVEVAWVDGWCAVGEWNKYPTQHSEPMNLVAGQVMAVMAFFQEAGGGDNMDLGWTGPGLSSDITNPTYLTDYITHIAPIPTQAKGPSPENGAVDVPRDTAMSWTAGKFAVSHDVYLGTSMEDVNAAGRADPKGVLVSQGQSDTTYVPPAVLEFGQTYYWRVDEVNASPSTIFTGKIWEFTVEPFSYPVEGIIATSNTSSEADSGPEKSIDGSGLNAEGQHSMNSWDMWLGTPAGADPIYIQYEFNQVYKLDEMLVWNYNEQFEVFLGYGAKAVTVEYSVNGVDWTLLGEVEFAKGASSPDYEANTVVDFGGQPVKYVRLTINTNQGGLFPQAGLSEVRFMYVPANAREPQPADLETGVSVEPVLSWRAGREAVSHEVYFGTDPEALSLVDTGDQTSYSPDALDLGITYYWKVDEVNEADEVTVWPGAVWSFVAQEYLVVDDFESYDDEDNRIYDTWIDGFVNGTGSTVGHFESPFAEQTIVHGGGQSMPLFYDNAGVATSEADFDVSQDWSQSGIQGLSLYFYGAVDNSVAQLYVKIDNTRIDYDGPAVNITRPSWQFWSIDLAEAGNVSNVGTLTIGVEGAGATGVVYIDDIRLYPEVLDDVNPDITGAGDTVQGVPNDGVTTGGNDNGWPAAETPDLVIDDNTATKFLHFKGETEPTGFQITPLVGATVVTAVTLTTANDAPERDPASFELYGSNGTIDGPYTLIASGDVVDFTQADPWPRFTKNTTPITFDNDVAYAHYQVLFPTVRTPGSANSMQIAEVELIGVVAP